jgi:hypothetical protein
MAGGTAETKAAKFSRLANARVRRAVKAINRVGALAVVPRDAPFAIVVFFFRFISNLFVVRSMHGRR